MDLYVRLNTGADSNGILKVWQDGSLKINQQHIQFRSSDSVGISSTMFSTFFGGGSVDYATPVDTATYFKNYQFSVGDTVPPPPDSSTSILSISHHYYFSAIIVVILFYL